MTSRLPLALLFYAAFVCAAERPTLPALPLGTASSAFGGGGAAHASGVSSVFDNPAALSIPDAVQAEAGVMGLSSGLSPYFLFGSAAQGGASSYALGYWYDQRPGDPAQPAAPRQGLIAGASWDALPWATLGGAVRAAGTGDGVGDAGFGIDEDVGAMVRAWKACWLGLAVHDLMESGVGQVPSGFRTHRSYVASLGTGLASLHLLGVTFHEPDAYYELRAQGLPPYGRVAHALSLASGFLPGGRLGFRGTWILPQGSSPGFALGTTLDLPVGRGSVAVGYAFHMGASAETGEAGAGHALSLNFRLGGRMDPLPPILDAVADTVRVTPSDTAATRIHFRLSARDLTYVPGRNEASVADGALWAGRRASLDAGRSMADGRIRSWSLTICSVGAGGLAGPVVRSYRGKDLPPRVIEWNAQDDQGKRLSPGFYAFRLEAEDMSDNHAATAWQLVQIDAPPALTGN